MPPPVPVHHRVVTDPATGAPVLVKRATTAEGRTRLAAEVAVLARLRHLDVVRTTAHTDDGEVAELQLAWVGHHSLATVAGVPPEGVAALLATVAHTVAGLHAAGVVHGALRADHVLLAADGTPVLTGLAHARPLGGGALEGTTADPADDVADLGALLIGLVGPADPAVLVPERRGRRSRDAGTRSVLLTLADRATADDPSTRPSAAQLAADLRTLAPRGGAAPSPGPPESGSTAAAAGAARPPRRWPAPPRRWPAPPRPVAPPAVVALAALVGLAAALLAVAAWRVAIPSPSTDAATTDDASPDPPATTRSPASRRPTPSTSSTTRPASPPPTPNEPPHRSPATEPPTTVPAPPDGPATPARCAPASSASADVDGDGCPDPLRIDGERVSVGDTTWIVGRDGDLPVVGDWRCDGVATVALLRPATGEVFVFREWARPGADVTVTPSAVVAGADGLRAGDTDADGCASLLATMPSGPPVAVDLGASR